jgi:hypothetical protein
MTNIFSQLKSPGPIINRILVASRQASTNLSVSIPRSSEQGHGKLLDVTGRSHILIHVANTSVLMLLVASVCGMGLFPQLQGVSSSRGGN